MNTTTATRQAIGHPFIEDEPRSRFDRMYPRWVGWCRECGGVGFLYSRPNGQPAQWRHKPVRNRALMAGARGGR